MASPAIFFFVRAISSIGVGPMIWDNFSIFRTNCAIAFGTRAYMLHREHTMLLSREREKIKERKQWTVYLCLLLSSLFISFILRVFTGKTAAYKSCVTLVPSSAKFFFGLYKIWQTKKNFCWARKGLGTSLALQCYPGFVSSGFPSKIA